MPHEEIQLTPGMPLPFRVVKQAVSSEFDPNTSRTVEVWTITFETPSGIQSSIRVPGEVYSAENVAELIAPKALEIEAVQALGN